MKLELLSNSACHRAGDKRGGLGIGVVGEVGVVMEIVGVVVQVVVVFVVVEVQLFAPWCCW